MDRNTLFDVEHATGDVYNRAEREIQILESRCFDAPPIWSWPSIFSVISSFSGVRHPWKLLDQQWQHCVSMSPNRFQIMFYNQFYTYDWLGAPNSCYTLIVSEWSGENLIGWEQLATIWLWRFIIVVFCLEVLRTWRSRHHTPLIANTSFIAKETQWLFNQTAATIITFKNSK